MRRAACADGAAPGVARCVGRVDRFDALLMAAFAALLLLATPVTVASDRIEVSHAELVPASDGGVELNAQFEFELPWALEDAVSRGIALYFTVDFELYRMRWYWFDRRVAASSISYRLTYSPLTRQYRLARGTLALPFETLRGAMAALRRVSSWRVLDDDILQADVDYRAQVRMRLDTSRLPRPFQVGALATRDWTLGSEWRDVIIAPELLR